MDIILDNEICYIVELLPEQQSGRQNSLPALYIPYVVLLHMLQFLCFRHVDKTRAQTVLDDLRVLVHDDRGLYVNDIYIEISPGRS